MSNATTRTVAFATTAVVFLGLALLTRWMTQPPEVSGFERVGEEFYPDFDDPTKADSLQVAAFDEDTATARMFSVEKKDGNWVIPSHHDYPAEATERLAESATSVIGITRGALMGRRKTDHERFGVLDPRDLDDPALKGRGKRITLSSGSSVLADLIVGKPVEGQENTYYVRRADEDDVYATQVEINLSTKFVDWVEPDLLKVDRDTVNEVTLNRYEFDPETLVLTAPPTVSRFTRETWSEDWTLDDLQEDEQVKEQAVDDLVREIDELKIVGVRPKPEGLNADLSIDRKIATDPLRARLLFASMQSKGFVVAQRDENSPRRVWSKEGEITLASNQGVRYFLNFGSLFSGSSEEIEIGAEEGEQAGDADEQSGDGESTDVADDQDAANADSISGRYLMVRVEFDESVLGPAPTPPTEPTPPPGYQPEAESGPSNETEAGEAGSPSSDTDADPECDEQQEDAAAESTQESKPKADEPKADEPKADEPKADQPKADEPKADEPKADEPKADEPADGQPPVTNEAPSEPVDPVAAYEEAKRQYEADLETYKNDQAEYERKLKEGREKVDELNERFARWYYVISSDSFEKLKVARAELVEPKVETPEGPEGGAGTNPLGGLPGFPGNPAIPPGTQPPSQPGTPEPEAPKAPNGTEAPPEQPDAPPEQPDEAPKQPDEPVESLPNAADSDAGKSDAPDTSEPEATDDRPESGSDSKQPE